MWFLQGFLSLIGRLMLCAIFFMAAVSSNIPQFDQAVADMEAHGVPSAKIMLIGATVFLIAGSLMIILGYKGRFGALLLLIFLVLASYYFHDFWNHEASKDVELLHFMKNLGLAGALVFILANGTGAWSLGGRDGQTDDDFL